MKSNTHPKYYPEAEVTCACGNSFTTGSTLPEIHVEICSQCHPFFTGEMKFVDTQGRVEKFEAMRRKAAKLQKKSKSKKSKTAPPTDEPKTLKEMLSQVKKPSKSKTSSSQKTKSKSQNPPSA